MVCTYIYIFFHIQSFLLHELLHSWFPIGLMDKSEFLMVKLSGNRVQNFQLESHIEASTAHFIEYIYVWVSRKGLDLYPIFAGEASYDSQKWPAANTKCLICHHPLRRDSNETAWQPAGAWFGIVRSGHVEDLTINNGGFQGFHIHISYPSLEVKTMLSCSSCFFSSPGPRLVES